VDRLFIFAVATAVASSALADTRPQAEGFARLIQEVQAEGKDNYIRPNIGPLLGLEPNAPTKAFVIDVEKDKLGVKLGRSFNQLNGSPTVVFLKSLREKGRHVGRYFKCAADGKLLSAIEVVSKTDKDGKVIRGSGVKTELDVSSSKTKKSLAAELDFWLSGAYKKHLLPGK
jgi:hypothetical protein